MACTHTHGTRTPTHTHDTRTHTHAMRHEQDFDGNSLAARVKFAGHAVHELSENAKRQGRQVAAPCLPCTRLLPCLACLACLARACCLDMHVGTHSGARLLGIHVEPCTLRARRLACVHAGHGARARGRLEWMAALRLGQKTREGSEEREERRGRRGEGGEKRREMAASSWMTSASRSRVRINQGSGRGLVRPAAAAQADGAAEARAECFVRACMPLPPSLPLPSPPSFSPPSLSEQRAQDLHPLHCRHGSGASDGVHLPREIPRLRPRPRARPRQAPPPHRRAQLQRHEACHPEWLGLGLMETTGADGGDRGGGGEGALAASWPSTQAILRLCWHISRDNRNDGTTWIPEPSARNPFQLQGYEVCHSACLGVGCAGMEL